MTVRSASRVRKPLAGALLGFTAAVVALAHQDYLPVGLTWNRTESLPVGLYWHTRAERPPRYGETVCFPYRAPEWARVREYFPEGSLICKRVLGLPGDTLERKADDHLFVCRPDGCHDLGRILTEDSKGRPVRAAELPSVIPDGFVYLGIPETPRSFDSRYLGLISMNELKRTIHPLWTMSSSSS